MSLIHGKSNRRILPRWRVSNLAASNADIKSLKPLPYVVCDVAGQLREQEETFAHDPTLGTASELMSTAALAAKPEAALQASVFVLQQGESAPHSLIELAERVQRAGLGDDRTAVLPSDKLAARTRALLKVNPNNPVLWSDLARHHASVGDKKRALRCMTTALSLAPNHRWMLRTASRFFVHQEDPDAAHKLLVTHPATRNDPWLIAAELACAQVAGRAPKYWKQAVDIIRFDKVSPTHLSELATAVAMIELDDDGRKRARKSIRKALQAPTENTLAQIFWAKENRHLDDGFNLGDLVRRDSNAFEASTRLSILDGQLLAALEAAKLWASDEPFAGRPRAEIAYIAALLDDYKLGMQMADEVRRIDGRPDDVLELNGICAQLSSGRYDKDRDHAAIENIRASLRRKVEQKDANQFHALANLGLWEYRYGDPAIGRFLYEQSILMAQKAHKHEAVAMAATYAAREAMLKGDPAADDFLQRAKEWSRKYQNKASEFYIKKLDDLKLNPAKAAEILSPSSAARFLENKPEQKSIKIQRTEKGVILWIPGKKS